VDQPTKTPSMSQVGTKLRSKTIKSTTKSTKPNRKIPGTTRNEPKTKKKSIPNKLRCVEVLDAKLLENAPLPAVRIESESCKIDLEDRIQRITGIPKAKLQGMLPQFPMSKSMATLTGNGLDQPKLQSSLTLLQTVEELKRLDINTPHLVNLKLQDKCTRKNLDKKMCTVLNVNPSERVYSHLQPLVMNSEQLTDAEESKRHNLAERCAPKRMPKDPELLLKDFAQIPKISREPCLPKRAIFSDKCNEFQIDPFSLQGVPQLNQFASYNFWLDNC